jgi:hypothetical protein
MYKGNDYDRELKKHGVSIDRVKPDPAPRELDHEKPRRDVEAHAEPQMMPIVRDVELAIFVQEVCPPYVKYSTRSALLSFRRFPASTSKV